MLLNQCDHNNVIIWPFVKQYANDQCENNVARSPSFHIHHITKHMHVCYRVVVMKKEISNGMILSQ